MRKDTEHDRLQLLAHSGSIATSPTTPTTSARYDDDQAEYELRDIESSDLGVQRTQLGSAYAPPYSATWEGGLEHNKDGKSFHDFTRRKPVRASTFATISSRTKPAVKHTFYGFLRYILRSGRYASHISYEHANPPPSGVSKQYSGWRGGLFLAASSAATVLLINLGFTIWAGVASKSGINVGTLYKGDCDTVRKADSWVHIAINVMGTLLLGASNYTMQCLGSPTRSEVDAAHALGKYMDVGLPSFKNLNGLKKKILFSLLVVSTLPLHFLWNSAIFTTTQRLDYNVYVVTPDFLANSSVDCKQNVTVGYDRDGNALEYNDLTPLNTAPTGRDGVPLTDAWYKADLCDTSKALLSNSTEGILKRLTTKECISTYGPGNGLLSRYANVLAVTKEQPAESNNTILLALKYEHFVSNYTANRWVCDSTYLNDNNYKCNYQTLAKEAVWSLGPFRSTEENPHRLAPSDGWAIDYCLAEPTELTGLCRLQYSLVIMLFVLIANTTKLFCILYVLRTNLDHVLATIGDAIASFLQTPDPVTADRPFLTRSQARNFAQTSSKAVRFYPPNKPLRWYQAPSWARWLTTLILCILAISIVGKLLIYGNSAFLGSADGAYSSPYAIGFGTYSEFATVNIFPNSHGDVTSADFDSNSLLLAMVTLANLPQVIVSCLYFAYNTVYTSMVSADEWSRFASHRKALRTTDPKGEQRSTYWLSLPWTYALPLAIASSVLHWLISQSLFVSRTEVLNTRGESELLSYMNVGYNPLAILLALLFGCAMVIAMIANGFRTLKGGGILVGNNSLAIAAACQRGNEVGAEGKRLRWGAVRHEVDGKPGHCYFSAGEVEAPRVGNWYI